MRYAAILIVTLLAVPAHGAFVFNARDRAVCADLRRAVNVRVADWSDQHCKDELIRRGLRNLDGRKARETSIATIAGDVTTSLGNYDTAHSRQFTEATCGDGTIDSVDPDLGEQCDDGNTTPGDGCDEDCLDE